MQTGLIRTTQVTPTEAALLGLLSREPTSGYDLEKAVRASVGYFWSPARSQIYAVLPRLVDAGLATRRSITQRDRPNKHVYRITAAGRRALKTWLEAPGTDAGGRDEFLLKVFFGGLAEPDAVVSHIRARRGEAERLKTELEEIDARVGEGGDAHAALTRSYGIAWAKAVIDWAKTAEQSLSA